MAADGNRRLQWHFDKLAYDLEMLDTQEATTAQEEHLRKRIQLLEKHARKAKVQFPLKLSQIIREKQQKLALNREQRKQEQNKHAEEIRQNRTRRATQK